MPRKTNKTSHVLNLLTNGSGEPAAQSQTSAASAAAPPQKPASSLEQAPSSPVPKVTVVDEADTNNRVARNILAGLTEELKKDSVPSAQAADSASAPVSINAASAEPEKPALQESPKKNFLFVNVMEELVKSQNLDKFIEEYHVCGCSRCRADVCALALTWLPPKYIVTDQEALPILLSYYGNRYRVPILSQLIKACIQVREDPRHNENK